jgi:hypothetical protein
LKARIAAGLANIDQLRGATKANRQRSDVATVGNIDKMLAQQDGAGSWTGSLPRDQAKVDEVNKALRQRRDALMQDSQVSEAVRRVRKDQLAYENEQQTAMEHSEIRAAREYIETNYQVIEQAAGNDAKTEALIKNAPFRAREGVRTLLDRTTERKRKNQIEKERLADRKVTPDIPSAKKMLEDLPKDRQGKAGVYLGAMEAAAKRFNKDGTHGTGASKEYTQAYAAFLDAVASEQGAIEKEEHLLNLRNDEAYTTDLAKAKLVKIVDMEVDVERRAKSIAIQNNRKATEYTPEDMQQALEEETEAREVIFQETKDILDVQYGRATEEQKQTVKATEAAKEFWKIPGVTQEDIVEGLTTKKGPYKLNPEKALEVAKATMPKEGSPVSAIDKYNEKAGLEGADTVEFSLEGLAEWGRETFNSRSKDQLNRAAAAIAVDAKKYGGIRKQHAGFSTLKKETAEDLRAAGIPEEIIAIVEELR